MTIYPLKKLFEACEIITDGTHQTPKYFSEGYIFLSSKNVTSGAIDWRDIKFIDSEQHIAMSKRVSPRKGDILLAKNGTTGVAAIVDKDEVFDIYVSLALLRPKDSVDVEYLWYFINSPVAKEQFNSRLKGAGVPNLHLKEIKEVQIPLPPLDIQKEIVAELNAKMATIKALREKRIQQIADTEKILPTFLTEIFEQGKRDRWEEVMIKDIASVKGGKRLPKGDKLTPQITNHPYLRVTDFKNGVLNEHSVQFINQMTFDQISRYTINSNDIFISIAGTIGLIALIPEKFDGASLTENAAKICGISDSVVKDFLYWQLKSEHVQENFHGRQIQTTIPKLALYKIEEQKIVLPPLPIQKDIVARLDATSERVKTLKLAQEAQLADLFQLEKAILREVFAQS